jgi:hypothetical protein
MLAESLHDVNKELDEHTRGAYNVHADAKSASTNENEDLHDQSRA